MQLSAPLTPAVQPALNPNMAALQAMLKKAHVVTVAGKFWNIDSKIAFWPDTGRFKCSQSLGGRSGTLRGRAESMLEQIEKELQQAI